MYENRCNMEVVYVMGHRLIVFLDDALPQHPQFTSPDPSISFMRSKSRHDLDWILKRLDVVALRIDEDQLNKFILNDLAAQTQQRNPGVWSDVQQERGEEKEEEEEHPIVNVSFETEDSLDWEKEEEPWEAFAGWSVNVDTEQRELEWEEARDVSFETYAKDDGPIVHDISRVKIDAPDDDASFLQKISGQDVPYETDSEAVDSWAQDEDSNITLTVRTPLRNRLEPNQITDQPPKVVTTKQKNRPKLVDETGLFGKENRALESRLLCYGPRDVRKRIRTGHVKRKLRLARTQTDL